MAQISSTERKGCTAIYARVSAADQHSGIEAQARTLSEYCERQGVYDFELKVEQGPHADEDFPRWPGPESTVRV
jgi:predicted site-specific integrase-resolvase